MAISATGTIPIPDRNWSRYRHPESTIRFAVILAVLSFLAWSTAFLNIDLSRILGAFPRLAAILATRYFPPDLEYVSDPGFLHSVMRTLEMSLLGGALGVLCSIPLAWLAARNITVSRRIAYPLGRFAIMGSRSIHETIWTILFVTVLGFGMLAGTLALTVFCVGFAGKLFSDELEAIDMGPVEAMRSVGANPLQVFQYAVLPQVRVAFTGIAATGGGGIAGVSAGIAEALVETALGLFVAIPAVWFYNILTSRLEYFNVEMDNSSSELVDYFIKKTA